MVDSSGEEDEDESVLVLEEEKDEFDLDEDLELLDNDGKLKNLLRYKLSETYVFPSLSPKYKSDRSIYTVMVSSQLRGEMVITALIIPFKASR